MDARFQTKLGKEGEAWRKSLTEDVKDVQKKGGNLARQVCLILPAAVRPDCATFPQINAINGMESDCFR